MSLELSLPHLRIGLWLDDLQLSLREALKQAAPWKPEAVGLDAFGAEVSPAALTATGRKDLAQRIRHSGMPLLALRADTGGRRLAGTKHLDANLGRLRAAFELARDLGVRQVVVPLGHVPAEDDPAGTQARPALSEAVKALASFGSELGIRPVAPAGHESAAVLAAFLQAHDRGGLFGIDLNPGRLVSRGEAPLAALPHLAGRIALVSSSDHYLGGGEALFGEGDVPWGELIVTLSSMPGTEPPTMLAACARECDRVQALRTALERLKKWRLKPLG